MKHLYSEKKGAARLWELAGHRKGLVTAACVLAVLGVVVSFLPFWAIYKVVEEIIPHISDLALADKALMIRYGWIACGAAMGSILLNFLALMCSHLAAFTTLRDLKYAFLEHLAKLPMGFHTGESSGKLRKIVDENIEKLESFIAHQLPDLAGSIATPLLCIVIVLALDWRLGVAVLVPVVLSFVIQFLAYGQDGAREWMSKYQTSLEDMNNSAVEYVRGISVVKAFNQTIYSFRRFYETIHEYTVYVGSYTKSFAKPYALFMVIINNIYLFVIPVVILLAGGVSDYPKFVLTVLFYLIFAFSCTSPFTRIMYVSGNMRQVSESIGRMDLVLRVKPLDEPEKSTAPRGNEVSFEHVSFRYSEQADAALKDVSFTAKPGQITALVGPSGSGKSTIASLTARFYDVDEGAIRIGGVDLREIGTPLLMEQVAFVFQDVFLFKQSILDNIRIGRPDATEQEVIDAAKAAQCHDFVERLPDGYHTVLGKGIHLSGGEQQRLVIARAILKNAPILVLDEATAFADPENEHKIQLALAELMREKTVLMIAHRLGTIRSADQIIVVNEGEIVERGTHEDLLKSSGRYASMWAHYQQSLDWGMGREVKAHV